MSSSRKPSCELVCYKCGASTFKSAQGLSRHELKCDGAGTRHTTMKKRGADYLSHSKYDNGTLFDKLKPTSHLKKKRQKQQPSPACDDFCHDEISAMKERLRNQEYMRECDVYFEAEANEQAFYDEESDSELYSQSDNSDNISTNSTNLNNMPTQEAKPPYVQSDVGIPGAWMFSIDLAEILGGSRNDLKMFDKINDLVRKHSNGRELKFSSHNLPSSRSSFINNLEDTFQSSSMRPVDVDVELTSGAEATVSVFDLEAQILSLLHDETLMHPDNLAEGYDIYTGKSTKEDSQYGEIHTGDAWEPARKHYCGDDPNNQFMPIALIIFGDKSHYDLHGALSTTPITFTLSCFNEAARNSVEFWRPMAYIPNLGYGKLSGKNIDTTTPENATTSLIDEHRCLLAALQPLIKISNEGGIATKVKGKAVICKVWIHFFIGDTEGNNRWVGQYGGSGKSKFGYRDCCCPYPLLSSPNPICQYITPDIVQAAKNEGTKVAMRRISKHDISVAFMSEGVPLSDLVHGVYHMFPPELLHTTAEGLTVYICEVFNNEILIYSVDVESCRREIDMMHAQFHLSLRRNSERDFPRSSNRTGFLRGTQVNGTERQGNLFILLCLCHTDEMNILLTPILNLIHSNIEELINSLKLYISMEAWFHDTNPKEEVQAARPLIAKTISLLQKVFDRSTGQGWNIQKMHGLTKMQHYMCLFGSGINFYGGPGECNHKKFVKDTFNNTQKRIDCVVSQASTRYYETTLFRIAKQAMKKKLSNRYELIENDKNESRILVSGKYDILVQDMDAYSSHCQWVDKRKKEEQPYLNRREIDAIIRFVADQGWDDTFSATGYTRLTSDLHGRRDTFRCTNNFHTDGLPWYDWCMVEFELTNNTATTSVVQHPSLIHSFIRFDTQELFDEGEWRQDQIFAVVQSSKQPLSMHTLESEFISVFELGCDAAVDYTVVPIDSIVQPLMVFGKSTGLSREYCVALPKRKWGRYFGDKILND